MADISLKIMSDFDQAAKDFKNFKALSLSTQKAVEKFQQSFKSEQIDKFSDRNRRAALAVRATQGAAAAAKTEYLGLQREITRLIKKGLDPQDKELKRLIKDYDRLGKEMEQTTKKSSKLNSVLKAGLVLFSGRAILGFTNALLQAASGASELQNKFDVVFSGISRSTQDWVDNYSAAVARGAEDTKEFLTTVQDIRTGFGDSTKGAAQFSQAVVGVTNDLSSFSNVPFEEASAAIQSGLSGQFTALRRLGVGLNVNIINHGAYAKSINKTWLTMSNLEKQEAILTGILKQSKNAIGQNIEAWQDYDFTLGDAAKTSKSFANQQQLAGGLIEDVAGIIGGAFLPAANAVLTSFNKQLIAFRKWAKEGDNLKDALYVVGTALLTLAGAFLVYTIASGAASLASKKVILAIKGIGKAIAANPIGAIAVVITTVVIPALVWLAKNWDMVKFKMTDFALTARIKMLEFSLVISKKVLGALQKLFTALGKIPGIGKKFKDLARNQRVLVMQTEGNIAVIKRVRGARRKSFAESQKQHAREIANARSSALAAEEANNRKKASDKSRLELFKEFLSKKFTSEESMRGLEIEAAKAHFARVAEATAEDGAARIEFLQSQFAKIRTIEGLDRQERLSAEKGLRQAIEAENQKMLQSRLKFGQMALSNVGSMLSDLQQTFANAGIKSRGLAIAMKAVASAQAAINTALAFTSALATVPYPFNFIAGATVIAAGLAAQARIISTPIPSAQTGLTDFTVPDTPGNKNDGAAFKAAPGETVNVTPRGESAAKMAQVEVKIGEAPLISVIQKWLDTGKLTVNDRNIKGGVFAS